MKISELVEELERLRTVCGDAQVVIDDADTGWYLRLNDVRMDVTKMHGTTVVLSTTPVGEGYAYSEENLVE